MESDLNPGRTIVAEAFLKTLRALRGQTDVTEIDFRDQWHRRIAASGEMTWEGWYTPPSNGMAVLFASGADASRVHFRTFRDRESYVSSRVIDWADGVILGYASNVHRMTGLPGDFATTVYLGEQPRIIEHFRRARAVCRDIIAAADGNMTAGELHRVGMRLLAERGLAGTTHSDTDPNGDNIGHTLPRLPVVPVGFTLRPEQVDRLRHGRKFLRRDGDWRLDSVNQFTIEPQVVSSADASLPKVMLHYVVSMRDGVAVCDRCEDPLAEVEII
nr:hypothetical protein GCM10020241_00810 [Streptoalloteichus tenebrarius]